MFKVGFKCAVQLLFFLIILKCDIFNAFLYRLGMHLVAINRQSLLNSLLSHMTRSLEIEC